MYGAIVGSHIKLAYKSKRAYMSADFWCWHDVHTVLLQGIYDHDKSFLDLCVFTPGCTYDATYLRKSSFYKKLMENAIL